MSPWLRIWSRTLASGDESVAIPWKNQKRTPFWFSGFPHHRSVLDDIRYHRMEKFASQDPVVLVRSLDGRVMRLISMIFLPLIFFFNYQKMNSTSPTGEVPKCWCGKLEVHAVHILLHWSTVFIIALACIFHCTHHQCHHQDQSCATFASHLGTPCFVAS